LQELPQALQELRRALQELPQALKKLRQALQESVGYRLHAISVPRRFVVMPG